MKLTNIATKQINIIQDIIVETTGFQRNPKLFSYHLLKSINNIISENVLSGLLTSGLSNFQQYLTPGVSPEHKDMLDIIAPQRGGLAALNNLVEVAKTYDNSIFKQPKWFQKLFNIMGVENDTEFKRFIINNAKAIQASAGSQSGSSSQGNSKGSQQRSQTAKSAGSSENAEEGQIEVHPAIRQLIDIENTLKGMVLRKIPDKEASAKILQLAQTLYNSYHQASPQAQAVEECLNRIASQALRLPIVIDKSHIIIPEAIISSTNCNIISEFNWKSLSDRISKGVSTGMGAASSALGAIANPEVAAAQAQQKSAKFDNQRYAKVIINLALDKLRDRYIRISSVYGLNPQQISELIKKIKEAKYSGKDNNPEIAAYKQKLYMIRKAALIKAGT